MPSGFIRTIAIALIRRPGDGAVLAMYYKDPLNSRRFYRPLGGGIEFTETSEVAIRREIWEELQAEIEPLRIFQVVENIFTYDGGHGHEIVFIWECRLLDETLYQSDEVAVDENGVSMVAHWVHPDRLASDGIHFYPEELAHALHQTP